MESIEFFVSRFGDTACVIRSTGGAGESSWNIGISFLRKGDLYSSRLGKTISFARAYSPTGENNGIHIDVPGILSHRAALVYCLLADYVPYAPNRFERREYAVWASDLVGCESGEKSTWPLGELKKAGMTTANQDHAHVFNDGAWEVVYK